MPMPGVHNQLLMGVPTLRCDTPQSVASVVEREDKLRKFDPILSDLRSSLNRGMVVLSRAEKDNKME